jgi:hypothetical protein
MAIGTSAMLPEAVMTGAGSTRDAAARCQGWKTRCHDTPGAAAGGADTVATTAEALTAMGASAMEPEQVTGCGGWARCRAARRQGW